MADNYETIALKLEFMAPFKGNSLSATVTKTWGTFTYKVYSYRTLIAEKSWDGSEGEWNVWVYPDKISVTTSRHQNLIRKAWGL